ncbi:MAG: glycoside hydrolase family 57 protein [Actinobacteria bacterium]|nr:glycoside hydrolase family 57 protein [Actinomycetota bacterium]
MRKELNENSRKREQGEPLTMLKGYFSFVLHTHMPYVRKNGKFPVGEDWLYQVLSDTYIPLLGTLAELEHEGIRSCMAVTLTPVLCEQLRDPYVREQTTEYFKTMIKHTEEDIKEFSRDNDRLRLELAKSYLDDFRRRLKAYAAIDGDILGAFRYFEKSGMIETIGSCATHAFLPAQKHRQDITSQVLIGLHSHRENLGTNPKGFWLPECGYRDGIEDILDTEGIDYLIVDPSALPHVAGNFPCYIGGSNITALKRNKNTHLNVWSPSVGYPGDGNYLDSVKRHHNSGLYYWKVTGRGVSIEDKELYVPNNALARAFDHCGHFIKNIQEELDKDLSPKTVPGGDLKPSEFREMKMAEKHDIHPLVLASYDTELFGHAWREGVYWIEITLRSLAASESIRLALPHQYLESNPPADSCRPLGTTWGENNDDSTWVNPETSWIWENLEKAQERFSTVSRKHTGPEEENSRQALEQAARELLLLESSDWPFMVAKDRAKKYATERFNNHLERFDIIVGALEKGNLESIRKELEEIENLDNIFRGSIRDITSYFR